MVFSRSTIAKLRALRRLPPVQRSLLVQAVLLLRAIDPALQVLGLGFVQRVLARLSRQSGASDLQGDEPAVVLRAWAVSAAVRHGHPRASCLSQSLALWCLLRRLGAAPELRIGVRKHDDRLEAHAWVELHGLVVLDPSGDAGRYTPFDRAIAPPPVMPR